MANDPARTKVFISYSHKDKRWLEQIQVHLRPLEREGIVDRWDDTRIRTGQKWKEEIDKALSEAKVAVLLISPDFLASDFVVEDELPPILAAQEKEGLVVMPLLLSPSLFTDTKVLSQFEAINNPSKTLSEFKTPGRGRILVRLAREIRDVLEKEQDIQPERNTSHGETDQVSERRMHPAKYILSESPGDQQTDLEARAPENTSSTRFTTRCIGRTKALKRCRDSARWLFCWRHRWQAFVLAFAVLGVIAVFAGLSRDLVKPLFEGDSSEAEVQSSELPVSNRTADTQPNPSSAPVTSPGTGTLDVQVSLEGCDKLAYDINLNNRITGSGQANEKRQVAEGTYTITLKSSFGTEPTEEGVVVQEGQTTIVDFTQELGKLRVNGYPQLGLPIYSTAPSYRVSPGSDTRLVPNANQCGSVGTYKVTFSSFSGHYQRPITLALFPDKTRVEFDVEVKAGETTIFEPASWPEQLGRLAFLPAMAVGKAQIEDLQNNAQFQYDRSLNSHDGQYWMMVGKYRITLFRQPYAGTTYEFEIKAGEETVLQLPTSR